MEIKLAKSAMSVQQALDSMNLKCKVLELSSNARTAQDAATSLGCDASQIVKSLIFKTIKENKPVLVLASGKNQVDIKLIANHLGEEITKADADFVRAVTGFAIGGIPPIGHKTIIDTIYLDQDFLSMDEVWAAAGTPSAVFCIKVEDLLKASNAKVIVISNRGINEF